MTDFDMESSYNAAIDRLLKSGAAKRSENYAALESFRTEVRERLNKTSESFSVIPYRFDHASARIGLEGCLRIGIDRSDDWSFVNLSASYASVATRSLLFRVEQYQRQCAVIPPNVRPPKVVVTRDALLMAACLVCFSLAMNNREYQLLHIRMLKRLMEGVEVKSLTSYDFEHFSLALAAIEWDEADPAELASKISSSPYAAVLGSWNNMQIDPDILPAVEYRLKKLRVSDSFRLDAWCFPYVTPFDFVPIELMALQAVRNRKGLNPSCPVHHMFAAPYFCPERIDQEYDELLLDAEIACAGELFP